MRSYIINVYKERGYTSHDVVARLRGILKEKKIGHTGTLDPDAEGVLPICVRKATKVCADITDWDKEYRAVWQLGIATDTYDTTGEVLERHDVTVDETAIREMVGRYTGTLMQTTPPFSARKVGGKKLYEYARANEEVTLPVKEVTVYEMEIEEIALPLVTLRIRCSKGTYIRSLCHDMGRELGCGGAMAKLLRTRVGRFHVEDSLTLSQIEEIAKKAAEDVHRDGVEDDRKEGAADGRAKGVEDDRFLAIDRYYDALPSVELDKAASRAAHFGNPLSKKCLLWKDGEPADLSKTKVRLYDNENHFLGIYRLDESRGQFKVETFYYDADE